MPDNSDYEYRLFESARAKYSVLLTEFQKDDDLIDGVFKNVVPATWSDESTEIIAPPTASDAIQNAADHILSNPRISVPVRPVEIDTLGAQQTAARVQDFYQKFWDNAFVHCGDPLGAVKVPLIKGMGVIKKTLNWDLIPTLPENPTRAQKDRFKRQLEKAGRSTFLWNIAVIPKETVFAVGDPWNPDGIFEAYDITPIEAIKRFPALRDTYGGDPDLMAKVAYVEYWEKPAGDSKGKFIQWVAGERVHDKTNPYCWEHALSTEDEPRYDGYLPYAIGDPGWGDLRPDDKPEDRYVSLIRHSRSVLDAECRFLTEMHEYLKLYIWKPLVGKNIPEGLSMAPGAIWSLKDDQEVEFLQPGEMPVSLLQGLARVNQYVDQTAKLGALGGQAQRGVDTATEQQNLSQNAATKLNGPVRAMRRMIMQLNTQIGQDIERVIEAPVTLYGATGGGPSDVTVRPSDFNGFYMTSVELDTSDEAAINLRQARMWADLGQRLKIPDTFVLKQAGVQNGTRLKDEWLLEQLEQSPQVLQALTMLMVNQLGQEGQMVGDSMKMQLMSPGAQAGKAPAQATVQPDVPQDEVAAMRQQAQVDAVQSMPERSMQ